MITVLAYIADAWVLGTYALMSYRRDKARWFHLANGVGCIPVMATEVAVGAWPPLVLTASFGALGWFGLRK